MAGVGRGKNYSEDKLKQLCFSVLHVSQDPAVGNEQRSERFWEKLEDHHNQHKTEKGEVRAKKSLEGKWADIKHDVSKFQGCYQQIKGLQTSGTNLDDTLKVAKELYKENHPKSKTFTYESALSILKVFPRWSNPTDEMSKQQRSKKLQSQRAVGKEKESPSPSQEIITTDEGSDAYEITKEGGGVCRPVGNKQAKDGAKDELKRAKMQEDVLRMTAEAQNRQANASQEMAKANFLRARTMENNSTLALLSFPTDKMELELQAFMLEWKMEEAHKLKKRMQGPIQILPAMFPGRPTLNPLPFVRPPQFPIPPRFAMPKSGLGEGDALSGSEQVRPGAAWVLQDDRPVLEQGAADPTRGASTVEDLVTKAQELGNFLDEDVSASL